MSNSKQDFSGQGIMSAWARISDALDKMHTTSTMVADRHLIGQVLNGVLDEASAYLKTTQRVQLGGTTA